MADSCSWSSGEFTYSSTVANLVKPAASPSALSWELSSPAGSLLGSSAWELGSWASLLGSSASELLSAVWELDWLAGAELCGSSPPQAARDRASSSARARARKRDIVFFIKTAPFSKNRLSGNFSIASPNSLVNEKRDFSHI